MARTNRILVVDDDDSLRAGLRRVLEREGFVVETAIDGLDALQLIDLSPPDLVICDIKMPELDGLKLVEGLRNHPDTAGLPVIFITASDNPGHLVESVKLKARHFLAKPFTNEKLVEKVRGVLRS